MKNTAIIGSTGSIGTQTLEIARANDDLNIVALAAGKNIKLLEKQAREFRPEIIGIWSEEDAAVLKQNLCDTDIKVVSGMDGLIEIAELQSSDILVTGIVGMIGRRPTIAAINAGKDIALANKETLVTAGHIIMPLAKEKGVKIVPVDSEHCAIHQCIKNIADVDKLIITASGGPFLRKSVEDMKNATVEQALAHPRWNMGKKITVDSATLMNKGLEVIEAHHLFDMNYDNIEVVVHPQSIVHSAIEYKDGSVIAQLGLPSMHIPIQYAITYPEKFEGIKSKSFSFAEAARLDFEKPDWNKFKALSLAYEAGKTGGSSTVCLNAANEEAVFEFLAGKIKLFDIINAVEKMMEMHKVINSPSLDEIFAIDNEIRIKTKEYLRRKE